MYVDLREYDVVLTTSFLFEHGISGHTFEMVEYYLGIKQFTKLRPCILLADGTTKEDVSAAIADKYDLPNLSILDDIFEHHQPKIIFAHNILIVDGSFRLNNAEVFADRVFLFRCAEDDFSYFNSKYKKTFLFQDFDVYDERYTDLANVYVHDYKKKILFDRLKYYVSENVSDVAMLYLTTNCRAAGVNDVDAILRKYGFSKKIILTNDLTKFDNDARKVPVPELWNLFGTYIYTSVPRRLDCSPRFIAECEFYGKKVIYDVDYTDPGLTARRRDIEEAGLERITLTQDDLFFKVLADECQ